MARVLSLVCTPVQAGVRCHCCGCITVLQWGALLHLLVQAVPPNPTNREPRRRQKSSNAAAPGERQSKTFAKGQRARSLSRVAALDAAPAPALCARLLEPLSQLPKHRVRHRLGLQLHAVALTLAALLVLITQLNVLWVGRSAAVGCCSKGAGSTKEAQPASTRQQKWCKHRVQLDSQ